MARFFDSKYSQLVAYLLIVIMGVTGFTELQNTTAQRVKDRNVQNYANCQQAVITREAVRDQVISLNNFFISTVKPEQRNDPKVIEGLAKLDAYKNAQLKKYPKLTCSKTGTIITIK